MTAFSLFSFFFFLSVKQPPQFFLLSSPALPCRTAVSEQQNMTLEES